MKDDATVFVIDDNLGVRKSIEALMQSVGLAVETYATGEEYFRSYDRSKPGCLVLDVRLGQSSGLDVLDELNRRGSTLPVIILTGHGTVASSVRALKAGAVDFLQKPTPPQVLLERIQTALASDRRARLDDSEHAGVTKLIARLTPREHEVMEMLTAGATSKQVAARMGISVRTVEGHRRIVFAKMNVTSAAQLVAKILGARPR